MTKSKKPKVKKHDPQYTVVNDRWEYLLRTEMWRSFPKDDDGNTLVLTFRRKYIDMRSRINGTIVVFKYFLHQGAWRWQVGGKSCHDDDIFNEMLMRCAGDRVMAAKLLEICMNQEIQ